MGDGLRDNTEKKMLAAAGAQSEAQALSQNTQALFTPVSGRGTAATGEREHALFGKSGSVDLNAFDMSQRNIHKSDTFSTRTTEKAGYLEPPADAADSKKTDHWNPSKGDLNLLDPSSWSKLQHYAGDVGRANGWSKEDNEKRYVYTFPQVNALRHALASAYVTFQGGASAAMLSGDWHELHTSVDDAFKLKPWSNKPKDIQDWKDHGVDINNNLAGAKIAQQIRDRGGSWQEVENAVVDAVKHHLGKDGRLQQPNVQLHTFLDRR